MAFAVSVVARGGKIVVSGLMGGNFSLPMVQWIYKRMTIEGFMVGTLAEAQELMALARAGKIKPTPMKEEPMARRPEMDRRIAGRKSGRADRAEKLSRSDCQGSLSAWLAKRHRLKRRHRSASWATYVSHRAGLRQAQNAARIKPYAVRNCGALRPKFSPRFRVRALPLYSPESACQTEAAKFVSAIFASFSRCIPLPRYRTGRRGRQRNVSPGPKGDCSQGSHWYYRIDRATKRHCWYLGESGAQGVPGAPRRLTGGAIDCAEPEPPAAFCGDAHAELPARASIEQPNGAGRPNWPRSGGCGKTQAQPRVANEAAAVIASRWPDGLKREFGSCSERRPRPRKRTSDRGLRLRRSRGHVPTAAEIPGRWCSIPMLLAADRVRTGARRYRRKPRS